MTRALRGTIVGGVYQSERGDIADYDRFRGGVL